jgi:uncharacterized SAM-binding protein YcdF (DUF218 family)
VEEEPLMFFVLSKTVGFLLLPSNFLLVLGLAGLILLAVRRRLGQWLMAISLLGLAAIGFLPVGPALTYVLESRFPAWDPARGAPDGIIVLGGAIDPDLSEARGDTVLTDAAERATVIGKLARAYPKARIVYTSGDASLLGDKPREADYLYPFLDMIGVARERVLLENRARNTAENAVFSKALAQPKPGERWLLVTSALHMPRAIGAFRHAAFAVEPYPVDWATPPRLRLVLLRNAGFGIGMTDKAAHEWIGLVIYRLTGRTDALFPAP